MYYNYRVWDLFLGFPLHSTWSDSYLSNLHSTALDLTLICPIFILLLLIWLLSVQSSFYLIWLLSVQSSFYCSWSDSYLSNLHSTALDLTLICPKLFYRNSINTMGGSKTADTSQKEIRGTVCGLIYFVLFIYLFIIITTIPVTVWEEMYCNVFLLLYSKNNII